MLSVEMSRSNLMISRPPLLPLTDTDKIRAWETGHLGYLFRWTQKVLKADWLESKKFSRKFFIESTRRLGKSSFLLMLMTEESIKNPGAKCAFFAPVKEGLLDYIEPIIDKTYAPENCPIGMAPRFDKSRFMLNFENGSTIVFRGSNKQQHRIRRGQEFHLAAIDEARDVSDLDQLVDSVVFPALFDSNGYMIISSTPADTRSHPLYAIRQRAEVEGWLAKIPMSLASRIDPEVYTPERIAEWKAETAKGVDGADVVAREYECEWVVNKSRAAVGEWRPAYVVEAPRDPFYDFYAHYVGLDWGYRDFTALVLATWNFRLARLEVESEMTFSGSEVRSDKISERLLSQMGKTWPNVNFQSMEKNLTMVSDSADPILINEINKYPAMSFVPVQKLNSLEAMLNQFRVMVASGKIVVSPKCPLTLHCLANAIWDKERKALDQDVFAHHFDHLMALVYLTRVVDQMTNPIPKDLTIDGVRVIELNFDKKRDVSEAGKSFEEAFRATQRGFLGH